MDWPLQGADLPVEIRYKPLRRPRSSALYRKSNDDNAPPIPLVRSQSDGKPSAKQKADQAGQF